MATVSVRAFRAVERRRASPLAVIEALVARAPLQHVFGAVSRFTIGTPHLQALPLYRASAFGNEPINVFLS